ncbi:uncharacterized protein J3D65DRAFT_532498, partial [Phyllosticta citribraziliensis]
DDSITGIQGLFMIDRTTGAFEFWVVKLIDILWDLFVGRGLQWLAGWISYVVFSSALLRAIEASPIPYRTFIRLSLGTPSIASIWSLLADLSRYSRKRSTLLFVYVALASAYVLAMPTLFGAMTGYINKSTSFTNLPDSGGQFVHTDSLSLGFLAEGLDGFSNKTCVETTDAVVRKMRARLYNCKWSPERRSKLMSLGPAKTCKESQQAFCSEETGFMLGGHNYTFWEIYNATTHSRSLNMAGELYCYGTTAYVFPEGISKSSQCLPNTDNPGYQWGFSALLSSVVLIVQLIWGCTMYIVWVEAQVNSRLLRSGYRLTELRGAFAFAAAAEATTGMEASELKGSSVKSLEKFLFDK